MDTMFFYPQIEKVYFKPATPFSTATSVADFCTFDTLASFARAVGAGAA
jgi:hypothetical protein